jgi:hypothetical protein
MRTLTCGVRGVQGAGRQWLKGEGEGVQNDGAGLMLAGCRSESRWPHAGRVQEWEQVATEKLLCAAEGSAAAESHGVWVMQGGWSRGLRSFGSASSVRYMLVYRLCGIIDPETQLLLQCLPQAFLAVQCSAVQHAAADVILQLHPAAGPQPSAPSQRPSPRRRCAAR